jgi:hypothetical protein
MRDMIVTIPGRFNGPPNSGHGGYVAGLVAGLRDGPTRVRLVHPPPVDRPLVVRADGAEVVEVLDGDVVIARGAPSEGTVDGSGAVAVGFGEAETAARAYPGFREHAFPRCFGCGPERAPGDGLRIFPGAVAGRGVVAAPWIPDASLVDGAGLVRPEFVWAAVDCPSGWAVIVGGVAMPILLGELTVRLLAPVRAGERCVLVGWAAAESGRKRPAGAALFGEDGGLRALARATWIASARGG